MCSLRLLACRGGGGRLCGRVCCGRGLCLLRQRAVAAAAVAEVGGEARYGRGRCGCWARAFGGLRKEALQMRRLPNTGQKERSRKYVL